MGNSNQSIQSFGEVNESTITVQVSPAYLHALKTVANLNSLRTVQDNRRDLSAYFLELASDPEKAIDDDDKVFMLEVLEIFNAF